MGSKKLKAVKAVKISDNLLDLPIRQVLDEARTAFEPYGWTIHAEKIGTHLSFEFNNPLSPVETGFVFESGLTPAEIKEQLKEHTADPEFARVNSAPPPRRRRRVLGQLRWSATWYDWSNEVFLQVVEFLRGSRTISAEEGDWLEAVGPYVLREDMKRDLQNHRKSHNSKPSSDTRES